MHIFIVCYLVLICLQVAFQQRLVGGYADQLMNFHFGHYVIYNFVHTCFVHAHLIKQKFWSILFCVRMCEETGAFNTKNPSFYLSSQHLSDQQQIPHVIYPVDFISSYLCSRPWANRGMLCQNVGLCELSKRLLLSQLGQGRM